MRARKFSCLIHTGHIHVPWRFPAKVPYSSDCRASRPLASASHLFSLLSVGVSRGLLRHCGIAGDPRRLPEKHQELGGRWIQELFAMNYSNSGSEGSQACQDKALYIGNLHSSVSLDMLQVCIR